MTTPANPTQPAAAPAASPPTNGAKPKESFEQMFARHEAADTGEAPPPAATPPAPMKRVEKPGAVVRSANPVPEPADEPDATDAGSAEAITDPNEAEIEAFLAKHKLKREGGKVAHQEFYRLRDEQRKMAERNKRDRDAAMAEVESHKRAAIEEIEKLRKEVDGQSQLSAKDREKWEQFNAAFERGDFEGMAASVGRASWQELQGEVIKKLADPNYKELQELKRAQRERDEREKREAKEREEQAERAKLEETERKAAETRQAEEAERERQTVEWIENLGKEMTGSDDPRLKALGAVPLVQRAIFGIQRAHWDGERVVTPAEALDLSAVDGGPTLGEELESLAASLFAAGYGIPSDAGDGATTAAAPAFPAPLSKAKPKPGKRPAPRSAPVPTSATTPPAPAPKKFATKSERDRHFNQQLYERIEQSAIEEAARRRSQG